MRVRLGSVLAGLACAGVLAACGGGESGGGDAARSHPGTPENPSVAKTTPKFPDGRSNEAVPAEQAREALAAANGSPCELVTSAQASSIVGERVSAVEGVQGPACIYQGKKAFVTVSVQALNFDKLKPKLGVPQRVKVSSRAAYCGNYGQQMLYVPLAEGQVLSVAAPCAQAKRFAALAVEALNA